ncbi:MAG: 1-acyl-sn-glycerol-3-phosphate acyltransferase [Ancrocorticia sp.]|jgi:1-acyl-sn-glycerol-3-phosphate acyltransferase|nr:1-acyl-sn-glycerol-3-phosphate acyltransferase [Ancrocorticia sp.]MCI1932939.1 1-acyl-sn-glycerol-3-phosphate acyltransferase [Ancrocorticia sp.]
MASGGEALEPLDRYKSKRLARRRHFMRRMVTRPVISTVVRPTVMGEENVEGLEGPFLVIPNHQSHLDAPMVFSLLPDKLTEHLATGAAADYFYRKRFISSLTSLFFNTYPVERKGKARARRASKAAGMTRRLLEAGVPILVFPEGTRSRDGKLGAFKPGAAALSIHTGAPIVPVAMAGGHEAMPVGSFFPHVGSPVFLYIGRPMYAVAGEDAERFMARVVRAIEAMLDQASAHPEMPDGSSPFDPPDVVSD